MEPADGISEFFEQLGQREREPLLAKVTGRVRFDLVGRCRPIDGWLPWTRAIPRCQAVGDRQRSVGNGFHEELTILNHDDKPVELMVRLEADCDFADLFEVKDALKKRGALGSPLAMHGEGHLPEALPVHADLTSAGAEA